PANRGFATRPFSKPRFSCIVPANRGFGAGPGGSLQARGDDPRTRLLAVQDRYVGALSAERGRPQPRPPAREQAAVATADLAQPQLVALARVAHVQQALARERR